MTIGKKYNLIPLINSSELKVGDIIGDAAVLKYNCNEIKYDYYLYLIREIINDYKIEVSNIATRNPLVFSERSFTGHVYGFFSFPKDIVKIRNRKSRHQLTDVFLPNIPDSAKEQTKEKKDGLWIIG